MPIKTHFDRDQDLKTTVFTGRITQSEFIEYQAGFLKADGPEYKVVLVDLSQMTGCEFGYDNLGVHAEIHSGITRERGAKRSEIILAPSDLAFGMARMYQSLATKSHDLQIFRDAGSAQEAVEVALKKAANQLEHSDEQS